MIPYIGTTRLHVTGGQHDKLFKASLATIPHIIHPFPGSTFKVIFPLLLPYFIFVNTVPYIRNDTYFCR